MAGVGYTESKRCRVCGESFSVNSQFGNPYKWCPGCRAMKTDEIEWLARRIKQDKQEAWKRWRTK